MAKSCYPQEHLFLLKCSALSDFNTEVKSIFEKEDLLLSERMAEKIEILSNNFNDKTHKISILSSLDENTLNYKLDEQFIVRYRSTNSFLENITPIDFEYLCAYYVGLLGCDDFKATRRSSDQGLDFYGSLPFDKHSFFKPIHGKIFLIGQAKLYTAKVGTSEIREFFGSIELLRKRIFSGKPYAYSMATELKHYTPINPIFITSSSFTKDSKKLCTQLGIRMIDIVKLLTLLISDEELFDDDKFNEKAFLEKMDSIQLADHT